MENAISGHSESLKTRARRNASSVYLRAYETLARKEAVGARLLALK